MRQTPQTYAVTIVCSERLRLLRPTHQAETVLATLFRYRTEHRFLLHAFVVMPDHLHLVLSPPVSLEQTIGIVKGGTSFVLRKSYKGPIWQEGYYSHRVRDANDFTGQVSYVAANPERKGWQDYSFVHTRYPEHLDPLPHHLGG